MIFQLRELLLSEQFGWVLAFSFLYGLLLLPLAGIVRIVTKRLAPETRYWWFLMLLLIGAVAPVISGVLWLNPLHTTVASVSTTVGSAPPDATTAPMNSLETISALQQVAVAQLNGTTIVRHLPWVWLVGSMATGLLIAFGLVGTHQLRKTSRRLCDSLQTTLKQLQREYPEMNRIPVFLNEKVVSPVLVGLIRPMILLPISAAGWNPDVLRFVILHELAHTRRWDNLINFCQRILEALLFFQPTIWLISRWVRTEREVCCDRFVVRQTQSPKSYAQLLVQLSDQSRKHATLLVTSSMADRSLIYRISCLLRKEERMKVSLAWLPLMVCSAACATLVFLISAYADETQKAESDVGASATETPQSPRTESSNVELTKNSDREEEIEVFTVPPERTRIEEFGDMNLSFDVPGIIEKIHVKPGERVKKGQLVAELRSGHIKAQLKELEAKANSTLQIVFARHRLQVANIRLNNKRAANKRTLKRTGELLYTEDEIREYEHSAVIAQAELDKAQEDQTFARLAASTKETELRQYSRFAWTDCVVAEVNVSEGSSIRQGDPVLTMTDTTGLMMTCKVQATDLSEFDPYMAVEFRPAPHLQLKPLRGSVYVRPPTSGLIPNRSYRIVCQLRDPDHSVRAGTSGEAVFLKQQSSEKVDAASVKNKTSRVEN